jgi:hypothetical protein
MSVKHFALAAGAALLLAGSTTAMTFTLQDGHHAEEHGEKKKGSGWKERDDFHEVMGGTFHPSEEGDLKPIRARARELAEKAAVWSKSKPPKQFDSPTIKATLAKLAAESQALADRVAANAGDEEIKKSLAALHDRFHEVVGQCKESAEEHKKAHP